MLATENLENLDLWQYLIFKWVLFIFLMVYLYRFADSKIHLTQLLLKVVRFGIAICDAVLEGMRDFIDVVRSKLPLSRDRLPQLLEEIDSKRD